MDPRMLTNRFGDMDFDVFVSSAGRLKKAGDVPVDMLA